jgi:hypothetical protein
MTGRAKPLALKTNLTRFNLYELEFVPASKCVTLILSFIAVSF